jgi:prophage regulatory protein
MPTSQAAAVPVNAGIVALTLPQVCTKTALRRSFVFELIARGEFPRPAKVGRRSIWSSAEIDSWLQARFEARTGAAVTA